MRLRPLIGTLLATGLAGASAGGLARAATVPPASALASLTPINCRSTLDPALRRVSVESVMRHRAGTRTLSVRITLLETQPGRAVHPVGGGDLGRWVSPAVRTLGRDPHDVWRLAKAVYDVDAPARYRFQVQFRWRGRGGAVLAGRTLSTGSCMVRELRPDVLVRSVAVTPLGGPAGDDRYVATIANRGATASGPFSVLLAPGGGRAPQTRPVASLAPHTRGRVAFVAPACAAADPATVVVDPAGQVDDSDRANNALTVICPVAVSG